jgi:hypothetical protein
MVIRAADHMTRKAELRPSYRGIISGVNYALDWSGATDAGGAVLADCWCLESISID